MENGIKTKCANNTILFYSLAYGVKLMESIIDGHERSNIYVMYDIACTMDKHLQVIIVV